VGGNPDFWIKGLPERDRIEAVFVADEAGGEAMVRQGQVDTSTSILNPSLDAMKASAPSLKWWHYISAGGPVFYERNDKRPTEDVRVRRAIALGFDRQSWLKSFELGRGAIDNGPPILAVFKEWKLPTEQLGEGAQWYRYDVAGAKRLLTEAGYEGGGGR
jgi:ABC-type transport system substrate-binding protein